MKQPRRIVVARSVLVIAIVVFFLWPLVWMVLTSFKDNATIADPTKLFAFHADAREPPTVASFRTC